MLVVFGYLRVCGNLLRRSSCVHIKPWEWFVELGAELSLVVVICDGGLKTILIPITVVGTGQWKMVIAVGQGLCFLSLQENLCRNHNINSLQ